MRILLDICVAILSGCALGEFCGKIYARWAERKLRSEYPLAMGSTAKPYWEL